MYHEKDFLKNQLSTQCDIKKPHNIRRKEYFTQKISILFKNLATYRKNSIKMSPSEWLYIKGVIHADMGFHLNQSIFISDIIYGLSWKT